MRTARIALNVPPTNIGELVRVLTSHADEVRKRPGCLRFEVSVDAADTGRVYLYEEWDAPESFETYRDTVLAEARPVLIELADGPPENRYFDAQLVE